MSEPVLPPSPDDSDEGWGDGVAASSPEDDETLRRLLDERPPHHDRG
jgi:hypothetical protein